MKRYGFQRASGGTMTWSTCVAGCSLVVGFAVAQSLPALKPELAAPASAAFAAAPGSPQSIARAKASMDFFRRLVAMPAAERDKTLAGRSEQQRVFLRAKLRELDALPPEEREAQLQALEIRTYLKPLMKMPAEQRKLALEAVPAEEQGGVEARLKRWDLLPPDVQKDVLTYDRTMYYVLRLEDLSPAERRQVALPSSVKRDWEKQLEEWKSLPRERRERMYLHFHRFNQLSPKERARVLESLSDQERAQTEQSLRLFDQLPPEDRQSCLESFHQLSEMPAPVRNEVFEAVERWKKLSREEQRVWKKVTTVLPPIPVAQPMPSRNRPAPSGENKDAPAIIGQRDR